MHLIKKYYLCNPEFLIKNNYKINITGFIPQRFNYNLDTINASLENDLLFIIPLSLDSPIEEFNHEGLRHPRFAFYHGNQTSFILLPVSGPTSSYLRPEHETDNAVSAWRSTVDSIIKHNDLGVFLLESNKIGESDYSSEIVDFLFYLRDNKLSFTKPEEVARHYILLNNISAIVHKEVDSMNLYVLNENSRTIEGLTFEVLMPTIEWECPYTVINGRLVRVRREGDVCRCFVATDVDAGVNKSVVIKPNISRKTFDVLVPANPVEGLIRIKVIDGVGNPVNRASVLIENKLYETKNDGILEVDLRRGEYNVQIEKPGFETEEFKLEIRGRIYAIDNYI